MTGPRQVLIGNSTSPLSEETLASLKVGAAAETAKSSQEFSGQSPTSSGNNADGTNTAKKNINFEPTPNPLSDYFQPTYHFSFYLDTDIETEQNKGNEFVIAESGLTGMNIQDVVIEAFVGPNIRTRNATATSITIKIYEPFGAMLPDLLFQAAVRKSIRNYLKAPWFLKLKFKGYDQDGKPQDIPGEWLWKLVLIDVQSQISENGSLHTISALPLSEVALNNQYCMLPSSAKADGTTVGEALKNIVKAMNTNIISNYGETHPPFIEFAIEDRPYPDDTKVGVSRPFDHSITNSAVTMSNQRGATNYGVQTGQFAPGTDIPAVVDQLMSRCDTAIKAARVSRETPPTSGADLEENVRDVTSLMHRVDTHVEYLSYDVVMGDYCKKITYIVKPYSTLRLLTSMGRATTFDKEPTLNTRKADFAVQKSFMHKQYDYIFTGLNTEVEKFDINVNFRWAVSVPQLQGWANSGTAASVDPTKQAQAHTLALQSKNNELNSVNASLKDLDAKVTPNTPEDEQTTKKRKELTDKQTALTAEIKQQSTIVGGERDKVNAAANAKVDTARKAQPKGRVIDGEDEVYANAQGTGFQGAGAGNDSYIPITIVQDANNPASETQSGTATDNNSHKSVYGALLNQLYGSMDGNLQTLQLEVKGDPYWLGPGSTGAVFDTPSTDATPNFMNGEHLFVFRFKLPLGYDESSGGPAISKQDGTSTAAKGGASSDTGATGGGDTQKYSGNSNIFTGFYATVQVTHNFHGGKFTQTLNGTRIQGWYYENIIEGKPITAEETARYTNSQSPANQYNANTPGVDPTGNPGVKSANIDDQKLLAITMVQEAGGEGAKGMQAVGNVVVNRVNQGTRGNTVSSVILAPKQFSAWNGADPATVLARKENTPTYQQAYQIAGNVLSGAAPDVTGGATSYLNVAATAQARGGSLPSWYDTNKITAVIGNHTFLKGKGV